MEFLDIANQYIPGYRLLSREEQEAFLRTESGQRFFAVVNSNLSLVKRGYASLSFWDILTSEEGIFVKNKDYFLEKREQLLTEISQSEAYQILVRQITWWILDNEYSDLAFLTETQKGLLAAADFSQVLRTSITSLDYQRSRNLEPYIDYRAIQIIEQQEEEIFTTWEEAFFHAPEMEPLRKTIAGAKEEVLQQELEKRADELGKFFPLLNSFFPPVEQRKTAVAELQARYRVEMQKKDPNLEQVEETLLAEFIFHHLQQATAKNLPPDIVLQDFNKKQASFVAQELMKAFRRGDKVLSVASWLQTYRGALTAQVKKELLLINHKEWTLPTEGRGTLLSSLSYLWDNPLLNEGKALANKLADAHAFIQATSFATQNESSFLAIIDLYNYSRFAAQIDENKTILTNLLATFRPLYEEYRNIGLYEKDPFFKLVRMVMPMVVAVAVVIAVSVMLSPLAIPDLAFTLVLIPTLLVALGVAARYVTLKNEIYQRVRQAYYGGPFKIPEFQVNVKMCDGFGTQENAQAVRDFYIEELRRCERLQAFYQSKESLSQKELSSRNENAEKYRALCMEWFDIHSNREMGYDNLPKLVRSRLYGVADREFKSLEKALEDGESVQIKGAITQLVGEVTTKFRTPEVPVVITTPPPVVITTPMVPVVEEVSVVVQTNYSPRLFKCVAHHKKVEEIVGIAEGLWSRPTEVPTF